MIPRKAKGVPFLQKVLGAAIIFEALAAGASYFVWHKLNNSRDLREKAKERAPWALEIYYKMGEIMSDSNKVIRETDEKVWAKKTS